MYERHGHTRERKRSPTHHTWTNMVARCTNPKRPDYPYAADAKAAKCDEILSAFAEDVVQVLIEMKAPGCQWLALTEAA